MSSNPTIKSHQELLSLSGYEENLTITPLNFSKVIAEYEIRDAELKCCLTDEHGKCGQGHFHGYVIALNDGSLSIMGKDCAQNKFQAHENVMSSIRLFKKTKEAESKLGRVQNYLDRKYEYIQRIKDLEELIKCVHSGYTRLNFELGEDVIKELNRRYKAQKPNILVKTFRVELEDDDDERLIYQATHKIGHIPHLSLFDKRELDIPDRKVKWLNEALRDAVKLSDQIIDGQEFSPAELRRKTGAILAQLDSLDRFQNDLKQTLKEMENFFTTDPISLCYLTDGHRMQSRMAEYTMQFRGISDRTSAVFLRQVEIHFCTKLRCDRIRADEAGSYW